VTSPHRIARFAEPLAFGVVLLAASAAPASAYIDPGTGSMMLQLLLGGVAGALVVGKLYLRRAGELFRQVSRRRRPG
jgi:hypothetical protein